MARCAGVATGCRSISNWSKGGNGTSDEFFGTNRRLSPEVGSVIIEISFHLSSEMAGTKPRKTKTHDNQVHKMESFRLYNVLPVVYLVLVIEI